MKATNKWGRAIDVQEENGEVKRLGLQSTSIPSLLPSLGPISQAASAMAILVGCLVLIGWVLDAEILKRILPGLVAMNPVTALAFILAGVSLLPQARSTTSSSLRRVAQGLAFVVALIGLLKLIGILFGWDSGIDQLLFREELGSEAAVSGLPNRMAPNTALNLFLLGGALLLLDWRTPRGGRWPAQYLILAAVVASVLAVIGYAYGVGSLYGVSSYIPMALHTALTFLVLSVGLLCARPDRGLMGIVTGDSLGGVMVRRLLPAAIFIPAALGWLRLEGERAGLYHAELGVALMVLSSMALLAALIGWNAGLLHRTDTQRKQAEEEIREAEQLSRSTFDDAAIGMAVNDLDGRFVRVNRSLCEMLGYSEEELLSATFRDITHPEDLDTSVDHVQRLLEGETDSYQLEKRYVHAGGHPVWVCLNVSLVRDSKERPLYLVAQMQDIAERKRAEEVRSRLASIVESSDDVIISKTLEGIITSWNRGAQKVYGYSPEEVVGEPINILVPPDRPDEVPAILDRIRQGKVVDHYETMRVTKDARRVDVSLTVSPIKDSAGNVVGASTIARDITEHKQAEETLRKSEARYRAVVDTTPDAVITMTTNGLISSFNPGAERIFGYGAEEIVGQPLRILMPERLRGPHEAGYRRYLETGEAHVVGKAPVELAGLRKDGIEFPIELSLGGMREEDEVLFTGIVRDVTERKQAEEAMQQAQQAAEAANRAKSEFLSRMSHELRTPLNSILGFAQLLEMEDLAPEERESVKQILKGGRHLLELINEVLDIARIEAGRLALSMEPIHIREVFLETLDLVRPLAASRGVRLDADLEAEICDRYVLADRQRLKQVLLNLLSNAVKYNREEGTVTLSCEEASPQRTRFRVSDTGPGIAPENMERLFTPFERLGVEQTEVEGTGIGLALSKKLVEVMGGEIGVESTVGQGSAFWVELALVESQTEPHERMDEEAPQTPAGAPGKASTALYIEDNPSNLKLVQRILDQQRPGVELIWAMEGQLGLDLAGEHRPDLILLDLHLPGMQGDEVLRRLREERATRDIPVVMLSADATPGQVKRLLAAGAQTYLTKPIDVKEFLQVLDETLEKGEP